MVKENIEIENGTLEYYPSFLSLKESDTLLKSLLNLSCWQQDTIKLFGKEVLQPRLTALFGEKDKTYTYSGLKMTPIAFPKELKELKTKCEEISRSHFTTCLANLYRDGNDSMGWHSDDEKELGKQPVIASVSLGAERLFHLKHRTDPSKKQKLRLHHGSLLIMKGSTQEYWKHQLPKTRKQIGPRVNLTFRKIY
ncbi:alpha-ketoglutarate-dependent dioxygenase AlkB family protein [Christiangramia salexigens]|uniref:Alpha-ketoglutarate-dependent dioxygenase AlkB n=1 Tax=Christiangramia salexigens TaxID=1913577 RepID=A0A1L3J4I9_9FLAO|nr:alpha-ketoglutarate-dependent dioxygenase AlkB [Christiangramia salexigens]APG60041.1 alpha-ketoglutarate-dependent dioxygenase AlkB [Christiangramia salexigens]